MSDTRIRILNFIRDFLESKGYAPTVRDIAKGCGISTPSVVQHHLNMLEKQGHIRRDPQVFRSLQLVEKETRGVPLLGQIAAGEPIPVPDSDSWSTASEESLELPPTLLGEKSDLYALRVKGTSMIDALIDDGDIVVMKHQQTAEEGEMVAVWLKDREETTLKRIYREKGRIRLQPANQQMRPIYVNPSDVAIQGKVIAVLRKIDW